MNSLNVLVTRPIHQSENLSKLIREQAGNPILFPVIEIKPLQTRLDYNINEFDLAIFISANAVKYSIPLDIECFAVGKATANCLKTAKFPAPPFNSEALLEMPEMQKSAISGKKIAVFRGEGGRELLAKTLRQRGASVTYMNVYKRVQPPVPAWIHNIKIDIIIITSSEGLQNFMNMLNGQAWIRNTPMVLISKRIQVVAENLGVIAPIFVAPNASDEGLLAAILNYRN
ncbi:uroporphyrinogen-III synthase [Candidatus Marithrix sp. Canyon 246]|uniref:uroporphyrinogen-III synthase n=1 Tax=Candidatus Marithrix sp. Canyon 246 TaxID=1827136 RepID=UPI00084A11A4|nr:uroporphyrinogen-III synthase [Candidatus Marithrix sp. Canyon 246]